MLFQLGETPQTWDSRRVAEPDGRYWGIRSLDAQYSVRTRGGVECTLWELERSPLVYSSRLFRRDTKFAVSSYRVLGVYELNRAYRPPLDGIAEHPGLGSLSEVAPLPLSDEVLERERYSHRHCRGNACDRLQRLANGTVSGVVVGARQTESSDASLHFRYAG